MGAPVFPQDPDATVRRFQRVVKLQDASVPSLHWEALRAYCDSGSDQACALIRSANSGTRNPDAYDFYVDWDFTRIPVSDLMSEGGTARPKSGGLGDIVMLGGKFEDIHPTPFGPRLGIEMAAAAIETELPGSHEPKHVEGWLHWVIKIVLAMAIAALNNRLLPLWAALGTILLIALTFPARFLGIYYGLFRMDFLPFMLGIRIEQLVEGAVHAQNAHSHHG